MKPFRVGLALLTALASCFCTAQSTPRNTPLVVKVLVLNYDPVVEYDPSVPNNPILPSENGRRLHAICGWTDPQVLAQGYEDDVEASSHGDVDYQVVQWRDLDEYPVKTDGFRYTDETWFRAWRQTRQFHSPDSLDYVATLNSQGVASLISTGVVDEVWLFGAPYFGYWESAMAGPGAFYINGGVYSSFPSSRAFAVMGFNYERGVAEMLHDLCHRTESTMARVYGGWQADQLTTPWARFSAAAFYTPNDAACGNCHFPPNAESDYDYANTRLVWSTADDWLNYPQLTGNKTLVGRNSWGGPDYHRNYMKWWFRRLPHAQGIASDFRQYDWWKYVFDFWSYDSSGIAYASLVRGRVLPQSFDGPLENLTFSVDLISRVSGHVSATFTATTDLSGQFQFYTTLSGRYDIRVRGPRWLAQRVNNVNVARTVTSFTNYNLKPGDIDADNDVDIDDYDLLAESYGTHEGEPGYSAVADLDGDGDVDIDDYDLLAFNYGAFGL